MIDVENEVCRAVADRLEEEFPGITVESLPTLSPTTFPYVSIEEIDNYVYTQTVDTGSNENHAAIAYEINYFSNKTAGKKQEAKALADVGDEAMTAMGFIRISRVPIRMDDATKYRIVSRYRAVVSKDKVIYSRR